MKKWTGYVSFALLFLVGLSLLLYPLVSDRWNQRRNDALIKNYTEQIMQAPKNDYAQWFDRADSYNAALPGKGVPDAFTAAPATLVGFIDMFIPALISTNLPSEFTRFVIGGLSLVQIIYLTEVGSIIVKADVGIDMKRLFLIFLERTVLALPLLVLAAHFILE